MAPVSHGVPVYADWSIFQREAMMDQEIQDQKMSRILARCWVDAAFKEQLLADPLAVLKAEGVDVPMGVQVRAVADTDQLVHLVVPVRPVDLSDVDLEQVAGGKTYTLTMRNDSAPSRGFVMFPQIGKQSSFPSIAWVTFTPPASTNFSWTEDYSSYLSNR